MVLGPKNRILCVEAFPIKANDFSPKCIPKHYSVYGGKRNRQLLSPIHPAYHELQQS